MLNRLLKYNYSLIGILLFLVMLKVVYYFTGQTYSGNYSHSLFHIFEGRQFVCAVISAVFTVLFGVFVFFNSEHHAKRTDFSYWQVLIFGLCMSFYSYYAVTVEYFAQLFFIVALFFSSKDIALSGGRKGSLDCFNLSFFLSIGTLFAPHLVYTLPLFGICCVIVGSGSLRNVFAVLMGFVLPFVFVDTVIYVFYSDVAEYAHLYLLHQLQESLSVSVRFNQWSQLSLVGPVLLLLFSVYSTFRNAYSVATVVRRYNVVNMVMLIYIAIAMLVTLIPVHLGLMLLFVPASYFYTNYLTVTTPYGRKMMLWIFTISIILSFPPVIRGIISLYELMF